MFECITSTATSPMPETYVFIEKDYRPLSALWKPGMIHIKHIYSARKDFYWKINRKLSNEKNI